MKKLLVILLCIAVIACDQTASQDYEGDMYFTVSSESKETTYQMDDFRLTSEGYVLLRQGKEYKKVVLKAGESASYGFTKALQL